MSSRTASERPSRSHHDLPRDLPRYAVWVLLVALVACHLFV
jgi:hypothetical protein